MNDLHFGERARRAVARWFLLESEMAFHLVCSEAGIDGEKLRRHLVRCEAGIAEPELFDEMESM
jgi:hypothetical protein